MAGSRPTRRATKRPAYTELSDDDDFDDDFDDDDVFASRNPRSSSTGASVSVSGSTSLGTATVSADLDDDTDDDVFAVTTSKRTTANNTASTNNAASRTIHRTKGPISVARSAAASSRPRKGSPLRRETSPSCGDGSRTTSRKRKQTASSSLVAQPRKSSRAVKRKSYREDEYYDEFDDELDDELDDGDDDNAGNRLPVNDDDYDDDDDDAEVSFTGKQNTGKHSGSKQRKSGYDYDDDDDEDESTLYGDGATSLDEEYDEKPSKVSTLVDDDDDDIIDDDDDSMFDLTGMKRSHDSKDSTANIDAEVRKSEIARRRKMQLDNRLEEERNSTIKRLLEKQATKRSKDDDDGDGDGDGDDDGDGVQTSNGISRDGTAVKRLLKKGYFLDPPSDMQGPQLEEFYNRNIVYRYISRAEGSSMSFAKRVVENANAQNTPVVDILRI